jgi:hypothetical protein
MPKLIKNIFRTVGKFGIPFYLALFNVVVYIALRFWKRKPVELDGKGGQDV